MSAPGAAARPAAGRPAGDKPTAEGAGIAVAATKDRHGENFPVASRLIAPERRGAVAAFYAFARTADDIADHPDLAPADKLRRLDRLAAGLMPGAAGAPAVAADLAVALAAHGLGAGHALALLGAFRLDAVRGRYASWAELMAYCQASAAPVGRFLLDLHGESRDLWPGADALCAALQIINHLQDCGTDFCQLDRIYIPQDMLAPARAEPAMLGAPRATPELRCALDQGLDGVEALLSRAAPLAAAIADRRLGLEVAVIHALARRLTARLRAGDPLAGGGRLARPAMAAVAAGALARAALGRAWAPKV